MQTIFIAGAWGSGTTAITGALAALGVQTFSPLLELNDPDTPVSFEFVPFRDIVLKYVDERALRYRADPAGLVKDLKRLRSDVESGAFGNWSAPRHRLVLKLPAAMAVLPHLEQAFSPTIVFVHRSLVEIERSCRRRRWPDVFGQKGAQVLVNKALDDLLNMGKSFLAISYKDLTDDPETVIGKVVQYCDLQDLQAGIPGAAQFVRRR